MLGCAISGLAIGSLFTRGGSANYPVGYNRRRVYTTGYQIMTSINALKLLVPLKTNLPITSLRLKIKGQAHFVHLTDIFKQFYDH